jgi:hypothetical protein
MSERRAAWALLLRRRAARTPAKNAAPYRARPHIPIPERAMTAIRFRPHWTFAAALALELPR